MRRWCGRSNKQPSSAQVLRPARSTSAARGLERGRVDWRQLRSYRPSASSGLSVFDAVQLPGQPLELRVVGEADARRKRRLAAGFVAAVRCAGRQLELQAHGRGAAPTATDRSPGSPARCAAA